MDKTGIVRRVDDLGRVVIPKEIRKKFMIHDGEPLELLIDEENCMIGYKKYNTISDINTKLENINKSISEFIEDDTYIHYVFYDFIDTLLELQNKIKETIKVSTELNLKERI